MNRNDALAGLGGVLLMAVCCGGPLLLGGVAIGPALLSAIGVPTIAAVVVGLAIIVGIALWRRRTCADCISSLAERETDFWNSRPSR